VERMVARFRETGAEISLGEAGTGADAVALARDLAPDVVLMDVRMPVMDGLEATRLIVSSDDSPPKVLVLTTFDLDEHVYGALRAGASGFLLKDSPLADLVNAVRVVAAGHALFAPSITRRLVAAYANRAQGKPDTRRCDTSPPREVEALRLIARGLSNAEIAGALSIAEQTAKSLVLAYECGLVVPAE
jgi:DNA-binding NarL/FixJ family response regulator